MRAGRGVMMAGTVVAAGVALFASVRPPVASGLSQTASPAPSAAATPASGPARDLYLRDCAWCHGAQGQGTSRGPSLVGVGAADAHFWLSTGRMPIPEPEQDPGRKPSPYAPQQIDQLVSFVAGLGPGPAIPRVDTTGASLPEGAVLYRDNCAACHGATGAGGALTSGLDAPPLTRSTPVQVAEAIRLGPGTMPAFASEAIDDRQVDAIAAYVQYLRRPDDRGGDGLGHLGPIPEGLVAWMVGLLAVVLVARWIGTTE